jgi:DNA-binding transcriptional LysR family regulator
MRVTHLPGVDLNLLPLLDALLSERHVTRAGGRVGLSQPAASRGLGRLRELLGDPLLVRSGTRLALTPRAEGLRAPVSRALGIVQGAIAAPTAFDPAIIRQRVRMVIDDYSGLLLLPALLAHLGHAAPGIDVWAVPGGRSFGVDQLVSGDIDLLLTGTRALNRLPTGVRSQQLYSERFVCVVRRGHPLLRGKMTVERFTAARHALAAPRGGERGLVDDALAARGRERRIALAAPHFLLMPFIVAQSDLVLTLGERLARTYAALLPITVFEPPLSLPEFRVAMFWNEKAEHDPALGWFRAETSAVAAGLTRSRGARRRAR